MQHALSTLSYSCTVGLGKQSSGTMGQRSKKIVRLVWVERKRHPESVLGFDQPCQHGMSSENPIQVLNASAMEILTCLPPKHFLSKFFSESAYTFECVPGTGGLFPPLPQKCDLVIFQQLSRSKPMQQRAKVGKKFLRLTVLHRTGIQKIEC